MVTVLVFPGQGAQRVGMARDLAERFPAATDCLAQIDAALGFALTDVMWQGPEDELQRTLNTQPAILAHSAAVLAVLGDRLGPVAGAAGHSLGEYSAHVAAGTLTPIAAARLVRQRGELMHQAGTERPGAMAAVLGLDGDRVAELCGAASGPAGEVVAANRNAPDQTVISGDPAAVARASEACKAAGAKRVMALKVGGAFHSPLMAPAARGLANVLDEVAFADPRFPVVANATAAPVRTGREAKQLLEAQVTAPVRWVECVLTLAEIAGPGPLRFVEIGPGNVLTGLTKRILPDAATVSLATADDVERFLG
ncbi:MAG: ACP S-malonyltransferase [Gemmatimonadetes bacterium]|nr:ACP S-malonyltransferase [Gemmatimonadota bacterium]